jgi:voltage-gated potassium channel
MRRMRAPWRDHLYKVIFEAETPTGKAFDVGLLIAITASVVIVMLDSVESIHTEYRAAFDVIEWIFTALFTAEYVLRLVTAHYPRRYARSFFGVIDLAAVLPTYLEILFPGVVSLLAIRVLRLLRIFRVFKLGRYLGEMNVLTTALRGSRRKVTVFLGTILCLVVIMGALMFLIEGPENGFTSIPVAMYWAIVTMTTVGYGDIAPQTVAGQILASAVMIIGYSIIAVPTGIVTAEITQAARRPANTHTCPACFSEGHAKGARYCRDCGEEFPRGHTLSDQS